MEDDEFAFDFSKKKKKKKVKIEDETADQPESTPGAAAVGQDEPSSGDAAGDTNGDAADDFDDDFGDFDPSKKKKKKKVSFPAPGEEATDEKPVDTAAPATGAENGSDASTTPAVPWAGSDRDYTYAELVDRVFAVMNADRPELAGGKKRYVMKPPQVCRDGTKKTLWINFAEICNALKRNSDHVIQYVCAELGTTSSIDGSNRLVIRGRFQPKQIENVLRHYISEYVTCRTCRSPETILKKENRLYFLCCNSCGSTRTVTTVKKGFEAVVGKRRIARNKLAAIGK